MKKVSAIFASALAITLVLSGCAQSKAASSSGSTKTSNGLTVLKVAADPTPHAELLNYVKPKLAKEGIDLKVTVLDANGDALANEQTADGEFDVNFFQHLPYLKSVISEKHYDLASAGKVHVEPIGLYSTKYKTKEQIPANAAIAIPNDTTNEYRALKILEDNGFIKLKSGLKNYEATVQDIATYNKQIKITELDSAEIIRVRDQFDGYITNTNKILDAGINASSALFREGSDSPYANILVAKSSRVNDKAIVKLREALQSSDVKAYILKKYKGAVIPAF
jgi:D-methionine transport system substrate-binding protein